MPGWESAKVQFVPAGQRLGKIGTPNEELRTKNPIERLGDDEEVIHVDTGLGPLDHHQTSDDKVCAASLTWDFIQKHIEETGAKFTSEHKEAVSRIVKLVVANDHFKEVFLADAASDYQEFTLQG